MVDVWGGFFDDLEEPGDETEAIVDEVKSWRCLDLVSVSSVGHQTMKPGTPSTISRPLPARQPLSLRHRGH